MNEMAPPRWSMHDGTINIWSNHSNARIYPRGGATPSCIRVPFGVESEFLVVWLFRIISNATVNSNLLVPFSATAPSHDERRRYELMWAAQSHDFILRISAKLHVVKPPIYFMYKFLLNFTHESIVFNEPAHSANGVLRMHAIFADAK